MYDVVAVRRALVAAVTALAIACGSGAEKLIVLSGAEVGTYTLATIDGTPPPMIIFQTQSAKQEVVTATVTLNADGSFLDVNDYLITSGSTAVSTSDTVQGSYARDRNTIIFVPASDSNYAMQLGMSSLTRVNAGRHWLYTK